MRRAAVAVVGAVLSVLLPGCARACPAIGWADGVEVDTSAFGEAIFVQVCVENECSLAPDDDPERSTSTIWVNSSDGWDVSFMTGGPDAVRIRVFDLGGVLLGERDYDIDWTRSTDTCGGPSTAPPIVLVP